MHRGMQSLIGDLNAVYRDNPALHRLDSEPAGFRWVVIDDSGQSVYAYLRVGDEDDAPVLVVCNFTPLPRYDYRVGVPVAGDWTEILNTDAALYGGSNVGNGGVVRAGAAGSHDLPASVVLTLPPLATIVLRAGRAQ